VTATPVTWERHLVDAVVEHVLVELGWVVEKAATSGSLWAAVSETTYPRHVP
jgi:hypothetical protein